jgi:hypothetical protein
MALQKLSEHFAGLFNKLSIKQPIFPMYWENYDMKKSKLS